MAARPDAECKPAPAAQARTSRGGISLIKAADQRILALEADLKRREGELQGLEQQLQRAQVCTRLLNDAAASAARRTAWDQDYGCSSPLAAFCADARRAGAAAPGCQQEELSHRDGEIQRLSSQLGSSGPDVDRLAWQYRNEANEAVILQLNQQVGCCARQLTRWSARSAGRQWEGMFGGPAAA